MKAQARENQEQNLPFTSLDQPERGAPPHAATASANHDADALFPEPDAMSKALFPEGTWRDPGMAGKYPGVMNCLAADSAHLAWIVLAGPARPAVDPVAAGNSRPEAAPTIRQFP